PSFGTNTKRHVTVSGTYTITDAISATAAMPIISQAMARTIHGGGLVGSISVDFSSVERLIPLVTGMVSKSQLLAGQIKIQAALRHQLVVRAFLDHLALVHHHDGVCVADGAQPVRDHDAGPPRHQSPKGGLDRPLRFRVERAGRLVEYQNGRIEVQG